MLLNSWIDVARTILVGVLAYASLVFLLRISGKRTLSKLNAFDLIVTVALGSTLATILLSKDVALAEGVAAFATLILLQFSITWLSVRSATVRKIVKSTPQMMFYRGEFLDDALRKERVTRAEIFAAVRAQGVADLANVEAVVLETDGSFTTLKRSSPLESSTLESVQR